MPRPRAAPPARCQPAVPPQRATGRRPQAARRVLVARVSGALFPGDSGALALAAAYCAGVADRSACRRPRGREVSLRACGSADRDMQAKHAPGPRGCWSGLLQISAATGDGALMEAALQGGAGSGGGVVQDMAPWPLVTSLTWAWSAATATRNTAAGAGS